MPPCPRVRGVSRVCTCRIVNVGQPSRAPLVDEEVNSYDGETFEGNPNSVVGDSLASVFGDSTPVHHPPSSNVPPSPAAPQGNIPAPPPPPPGFYPPPYYAPPPAGVPHNVPPVTYTYLYFYPPA